MGHQRLSLLRSLTRTGDAIIVFFLSQALTGGLAATIYRAVRRLQYHECLTKKSAYDLLRVLKLD